MVDVHPLSRILGLRTTLGGTERERETDGGGAWMGPILKGGRPELPTSPTSWQNPVQQDNVILGHISCCVSPSVNSCDVWFFPMQSVADFSLEFQRMRASKTKEAETGFLKHMTEIRVRRDGGEGKLEGLCVSEARSWGREASFILLSRVEKDSWARGSRVVGSWAVNSGQ